MLRARHTCSPVLKAPIEFYQPDGRAVFLPQRDAHTTALVSASFTSCPQLQVLSLEVSGDFDQCIGVGVLPSGLVELALPRAYRQPVSVSALPVSVLRLRVPAGLLRPEDSRARSGTLTVEGY